MDNREAEDRVLWTQQDINNMFIEQTRTRDDFIYALLEDRKQTRELYMKSIVNIVKWIMLPLTTVMLIFILSYFFSSCTDFEGNNDNQVYESSNIVKDNNLENLNIN